MASILLNVVRVLSNVSSPNFQVIPLRSTFPYQTDDNRFYWMTFDYISDLIYVIDTLLVQPRVKYLHEGFWVTDKTLLIQNYVKNKHFKVIFFAVVTWVVKDDVSVGRGGAVAARLALFGNGAGPGYSTFAASVQNARFLGIFQFDRSPFGQSVHDTHHQNFHLHDVPDPFERVRLLRFFDLRRYANSVAKLQKC